MLSKYESVKYTLQPSKYIDGELTAGAGFLQLTTQLLMYLSSASEYIANKKKTDLHFTSFEYGLY